MSLLRFLGFFLAVLGSTFSAAQEWPTRPVKVIVASTPGAGPDAPARLLAPALSAALRQSLVIDNRPGADGIIATELASKSAPDGYTFLFCAMNALVINPFLHKKLPYNAENDFAPVSSGVIGPMVVVAHPSVPVKTLAELIDMGRRAPGTLAYGSIGSGSISYLGIRMLEEKSGARFLHVPYKGASPAAQGLLAGEVQFRLSDIFLPQIRSGRIRPLAVTVETDMLPGVPSLEQAGYKEMEIYAWFHVVAPKGTPGAIVQRLNAEINKAMKLPANIEALRDLAVIPVFETPEEFAGRLKRTREIWGAFVRRNNIVAD
jgi:tripartite-type tricarboxylate transporter receptor subunit TctC